MSIGIPILKHKKLRFALITKYNGHGKKRGIIKFGNGFTIRFNKIAIHIWIY